MVTPERIAELRRLEQAATSGPWAEDFGFVVKWLDDDIPTWTLIADNTSPEDAALIVAARNALPELLDEIQRLQGVALRAAADLARLACGAEEEISGYAETIRAIARRLSEEVGPTAARRGHHDA